MSTFWLKLIGSKERPCPDRYELGYAESRRPMRRIRSGDSMVLYAVGAGKRVFALATVTREAYEGREGWPYRVDLSYEVNLPVSAGVSIDVISTEARNWSGRSSGPRAHRPPPRRVRAGGRVLRQLAPHKACRTKRGSRPRGMIAFPGHPSGDRHRIPTQGQGKRW